MINFVFGDRVSTKVIAILEQAAKEIVAENFAVFGKLVNSEQVYNIKFKIVGGANCEALPVKTVNNEVDTVLIRIGSIYPVMHKNAMLKNVMFHEMIHAKQFFTKQIMFVGVTENYQAVLVWNSGKEDEIRGPLDQVASEYCALMGKKGGATAEDIAKAVQSLPWELEAYGLANKKYPTADNMSGFSKILGMLNVVIDHIQGDMTTAEVTECIEFISFDGVGLVVE